MSNTVRLYHFINDKWGLESILKRHLKVAFPDQVNDLFEFRPFDFGEGEMGRKRRYALGEGIREYSMEQGFTVSDAPFPPYAWCRDLRFSFFL